MKIKPKTRTGKKKPTLNQMVVAARAVGAGVSVSLAPKETDLEPLRQMAIDLDVIYHLAKSRNYESVEAAHMLARRISYNEIVFVLNQLRMECLAKPVLERP